MAWIKAGTVAITNGGTTVTGSGTSWLTGVNVGDALIAPDGRVYEITAINSATSLTIAPAYQGSGVSGSDYIIAPTRGLTGTLAERVQSLISDFSDVKDNVGASKMSDFITYLLDQDTGWERVASNTVAAVCGGTEALRLTSTAASGGAVQSDVKDTSTGKLMKVAGFGLGSLDLPTVTDANALLGTGTGWSKAFGADNMPAGSSDVYAVLHIDRSSGAAFQMALNATDNEVYTRAYTSSAWTSWSKIYGQANILGAVSQSGGIPTGAVIEHGSNANGKYTKFADGRMICTRSIDVTSITSTTQGAGYTNSGGFGTFSWPATFIDYPSVAGNCEDVSGIWFSFYQSAINSYSPRALSFNALPSAVTINVQANGRWFA